MLKVKGKIDELEIEFEGTVEDFVRIIENIRGNNIVYIPQETYIPNDGNMWFSSPEVTCDNSCKCNEFLTKKTRG